MILQVNEAPFELDYQDGTLGKCDSTGKRYGIPMPRGPGDTGDLPQDTSLPPTRAQELRDSSGFSSQSSSDDKDKSQRGK